MLCNCFKQKSASIRVYIFISIFMMVLSLSAQNVFWVSTTGNDTLSGSQAAPFATINHALSVIQNLDTILVMPGNYYEQLSINALNGVSDFVLQGYSLTDTAAIISPGPGPVISINMPLTPNSRFLNLLLSHENPDSIGPGIEIFGASPTIENCTITGNHNQVMGGGIRIFDSGDTLHPVISRCHIYDNEAPGGAGIFGQNSAMTIEYSTIEFNRSGSYDGGGLYFQGCYDMIIKNNQIHANQGNDGAGIYLDVSAVLYNRSNSVTNNLIYRNDGLNVGAGMYLYGAGTTNTINDNTFGENYAQGSGGGLFVEAADNIILKRNLFVNNNSLQNGGGICFSNMSSSSIDLWSNHISGNIASGEGGGLYLVNCDILTVGGAVSLQNNFYHNRASGTQNAIACAGNVTTLTLSDNYWGFPDISAVQLQINIPGSNLSGLLFQTQPFDLSLPLIENRTLYYFGDGFIEFRPEALMLMGSDYLNVKTTIDTMINPESGLNFLSKKYTINFTGINPNSPTDIYLYYDQSEIDNAGNPPVNNLQVAFYDSGLPGWFAQPSYLDTGRKLVIANFSNFTYSDFSIAFNVMGSDSLFEVYPEPNRADVSRDAPIEIFFKRTVDEATVIPKNVSITGQYSGIHAFDRYYDPDNFLMQLRPLAPFLPGEEVTVTLDSSILDDKAIPFSNGFTWTFNIGAFTGNTQFMPGAVSSMRIDPVQYQLADVNADGYPDLVELSLTGVSLFVNDHTGRFTLIDSLVLGSQYNRLAVKDLDGDNQPEIIVANASEIVIYEYIYANHEFSPTHTETMNLDASLVDMKTADFNNDGLVDIALLLDYSSFFETDVFLSSLATGFSLSSPITNVLAGLPTRFTTIDINADGFIDMVANSGTGESDLTLLINQFGKSFNRIITPSTDIVYRSDFTNGNVWGGIPYGIQKEIIVAGQEYLTYKPIVSIINVRPDGNINTLHDELIGMTPQDMITADLTSDGLMDIALCYSDSIKILQQDAGRFIQLPVISGDLVANEIMSADFDLDGDMDILTFEKSVSMARWQLLSNRTRSNRKFYVDYRSVGGTGDFGSPFRTITDAVKRVIDNDSVFVFGGNYQDHLYIDKNLVFDSYGNNEPVNLHPFFKSNFDSSVITVDKVSSVSFTNFYIFQDSILDGKIPPPYFAGVRAANADNLSLDRFIITGPPVGIELTNVNLNLKQGSVEGCDMGLKAQNSKLNLNETRFERNRIGGVKISATEIYMNDVNFHDNGFDPVDHEGGIIAENGSKLTLRFYELGNNGVANVKLNNSQGTIQYGGIFDAYTHVTADAGAGIFLSNGSTLKLSNTVVGGNSKYGIFSQNSNVDVQNNIFGKNDSLSTRAGGGIFVDGGTARIVNNILGMNNAGITVSAATVQINYNDFFNNTSDVSTGLTGIGNISEYPLFVTDFFVFGGHYTVSDSGFDPFQFKLAPGSPLIDRGDPSILNGDGSRSDIGMFGDVDTSFALNYRPQPSVIAADSSLSLTWINTDVNADTLFRATAIFRSTQPAFIPDTTQLTAILESNVSAYMDRDVKFGQSYYYKLAFIDNYGGVAGYSPEVNGRLDFYNFYFNRSQEFVQLGQGDSLQRVIRVHNSGTLPMQVDVQDRTVLPSWLDVSPVSVNIAAEDSAEFTLHFSAEGMPKDTLLQYTLNFSSPQPDTRVSSLDVRMLVSYRDLFPPQTYMVSSYKDTVRQSLIRFKYRGDDQVLSSIGTPPELLRYQYSLNRIDQDTSQISSGITDQTILTFNPVHDGSYLFRVAALDTAGRGGLKSVSAVQQVVFVRAGLTLSPGNVWQMVSPSRQLDQFSKYLKNEAVLAIKSWKNEEYLDVKPENIKYGKGYWIITNRNQIVNLDNMEFLKQDTLVSVNLATGWNQIGNPWAWNLSLDSCSIVPADNRVLTYNAAMEEGLVLPELYYNEVLPLRRYVRVMDDKLLPKYGYWIYANQPVKMILNSLPGADTDSVIIIKTGLPAKTARSPEVLLNLKAQSGKFADGGNFFGISKGEYGFGRKYNAALEPPGISDYLYLYNVENNQHWSGTVKTYQHETETWDIRLERGSVENKTTLSWEWLKPSGNMHLFLYHLETAEWFDLNDRESYTFDNRQKINHFKLYASEDENFEPEILPLEFALSQNYPNPFNLQTTVEIAIPYYADGQQAELKIYDILGRKVKTLFSGNISSGHLKLYWNGKNDRGVTLASGLYFFRFTSKGFSASKKMMLIK